MKMNKAEAAATVEMPRKSACTQRQSAECVQRVSLCSGRLESSNKKGYRCFTRYKKDLNILKGASRIPKPFCSKRKKQLSVFAMQFLSATMTFLDAFTLSLHKFFTCDSIKRTLKIHLNHFSDTYCYSDDSFYINALYTYYIVFPLQSYLRNSYLLRMNDTIQNLSFFRDGEKKLFALQELRSQAV